MSTATANNTMELPCLGVPFQLGMLYDCRSDQIIPGITLWNEKLLKSALNSERHTQQSHEFTPLMPFEESISKKMSRLGIEGGFSLSVMSGLVNVSGSAKYLNDRRYSGTKQARVILKYTVASKSQKVIIDKLATAKIQHPDVFENGTATHVVTEVLYGAEAFFVFDREVESSESLDDIHEKMMMMIVPMIDGLNIKGGNTEAEKLHCKFYGDVLDSNPSTFQDTVKVYKQLSKCFEENTVPKTAWLYPLSSLDSRATCLVREISVSTVTQTQQIIEGLDNMEMRSHDLIDTYSSDIYNDFPIKKQLLQFKELINEHKTSFAKQLFTILPLIRSGGTTEEKLASLLEKIQNSPFKMSSMDAWLNEKEKEIKILSPCLDKMKEVKGIIFALSPNVHDSEVNDFNCDDVLSFEFNLFTESDNTLARMWSYLRSTGLDIEDDSPKKWFESTDVIKDLRVKVRQFTAFAATNQGRNVKFIVSNHKPADSDGEGAVIMHYETGILIGKFEPPGQPKKPTATSVTHESIQLQWDPPQYGVSNIQHYLVHCHDHCIDDPRNKWLTQKTKGSETTIKIDQELNPSKKYVFKVQAECHLGLSDKSDKSDIVETKPLPIDNVLQDVLRQSSILTEGSPVIYKINMRVKSKSKHNAIMEFGTPVHPPKPTKVIMLVGATGAGKSTLINGIVNHIFGVKWENEFRFKLIDNEVAVGQAHSQTQMITAYTFYWQENSPLNCNLTIIDTPGFGDTRGLKRDQEITEHIQEFFQMKSSIDQLHAIGFVTQASLARLTPTQKYISDSILSIFGKDVKRNIFIMATFADSADPPVMEAVKEAEIPYASFFPFNNSALFANSSSNFAKCFWEMGYASFNDFFVKFEPAQAVSLQLTREVLEERRHLEAIIQGIQPQITAGLAKINELNQEEQILRAKEADILANKDFKYEVEVTKQRKVDAPKGTYVTNCIECNYTCHQRCVFGDNWNKRNCSVMEGGMLDRTCTVCPGKCSWKKHINNPYYFELYTEMEARTSQELQQRFKQAKSAKANVEGMIGAMKKQLQDLQKTVLYNIRRARDCLQRLDEIALKPNPLTEVEYIDLLIKSEEQQCKPGWQNRVEYFYEVRQQAIILSRVKNQAELEEIIRLNSQALWAHLSIAETDTKNTSAEAESKF